MNITLVQENFEYNMKALLQTVLATMKSLHETENVTYPTSGELRRIAERDGIRTV